MGSDDKIREESMCASIHGSETWKLFLTDWTSLPKFHNRLDSISAVQISLSQWIYPQ